MTVVRRVARPMLAAMFISGGVNALRKPEAHVAQAEPVAPKIAEPLPLPDDTQQLVKINGAVQVVAGLLLALGRFPRLAAASLAASLVPTTAAGHRFWEEDDPGARAQQQVHFLKNIGLLGGLLLAVVDTGGAPSLGWRARQAARGGRRKAAAARKALPGG